MNKIRTLRIVPNYTNICIVFCYLICVAFASLGVYIITTKGHYAGLCQWKDELYTYDKADSAVLLGTTFIVNWLLAPLVIISINKARRDWREACPYMIFSSPSTTATVALVSSCCLTFAETGDCSFAQQKFLTVSLLILAIIPGILPVVFHSGLAGGCIIYAIGLVAGVLKTNLITYCRCFHVIEEFEPNPDF